MRLFVAVDIEDEIRRRISGFAEGVQGFAPEARWVGPETLHITVKFIGEFPESDVQRLKQALQEVRGAPANISFRGYGFFPTPKAARVFWVGMEADANLGLLATAVDRATASLGIATEERPFKPHLTLARAGSGRPQWKAGDGPSGTFRRLQEKLAALPAAEFGTMTAHEFFLYESKLSPAGARYTKLERFALREE